REVVPGKARRPEGRIDRAEVEPAAAGAALVCEVGCKAQVEIVVRLGIELEAAAILALVAAAVRLEPVVPRHRARNADSGHVADGQIDSRLAGQPVVVAVTERELDPRFADPR